MRTAKLAICSSLTAISILFFTRLTSVIYIQGLSGACNLMLNQHRKIYYYNRVYPSLFIGGTAQQTPLTKTTVACYYSFFVRKTENLIQLRNEKESKLKWRLILENRIGFLSTRSLWNSKRIKVPRMKMLRHTTNCKQVNSLY